MRLLTNYKLRISISTILIVLSVYLTGLSIVSVSVLLFSFLLARFSFATLTLLFFYTVLGEFILTGITGISLSSVATDGTFSFLATRLPLIVIISSVFEKEWLTLNTEPLYTVKRIPLRPGFYHHSIWGKSLTLSPYIAVTKHGNRIGMWGFNKSPSIKTGVFIDRQFVACPRFMPYEAVENLESFLNIIHTMFSGSAMFVTLSKRPKTAPIFLSYGVLLNGKMVLSFVLLENGIIIGRTLYESGYITPDDILKHIKMRDILQ